MQIFCINGHKAFRINFSVLIFVRAHVGMPCPLAWRVHVYVSIMSFSVKSMVRRHHIYKDIWDVVGEEFPCKHADCCGCSKIKKKIVDFIFVQQTVLSFAGKWWKDTPGSLSCTQVARSLPFP